MGCTKTVLAFVAMKRRLNRARGGRALLLAFRASDDDHKLLARIVERTGMSRGAILRGAIRQAAESEGIILRREPDVR